jgi:hypothetical protein
MGDAAPVFMSMRTLLATTRTLASHVLDFCLGTRLAPVRTHAYDSHLHWDRVVRTWR